MVFLKGGSCHGAAFHKNPPVSSLGNRSGWKKLSFCGFSLGCNVIFFVVFLFSFFSSSPRAIIYLFLHSPDIMAGNCLERDTEWKIFTVTVCAGFALTTLLQDIFKNNILLPIPLFSIFFSFCLYSLKVQGSIPHSLHKQSPADVNGSFSGARAARLGPLL